MAVGSISVSPTAITLKKGESYLNQTVKVNGATTTEYLEWCSQDSSIAGVHPDTGRIIANKVGTTKIYVNSEYDRYKRASITVTVTSGIIPVESVTLNKNIVTLEKGDTFKLCADVLPYNATNKSIIWSSSDSAVATVSNNGVITAKSGGWTFIYAEANDGSKKKAICYVEVTEDVLVSCVAASWLKDKVVLDKTLVVGQSAFAHEIVRPCEAEDKTVTWSSNRPEIAFVNPDSGFVTAKAEGEATIRATANDGSDEYGECTVTVVPPIRVTGIGLYPQTKEMCVGRNCGLSATVYPSDATNKRVIWCSSNEDVATVGLYTGIITGKKAGTTTITATTYDGGFQASCTVNVGYSTIVDGRKITLKISSFE